MGSGIPGCDSSECEELAFECHLPFSIGSWESVLCMIWGIGEKEYDLYPQWDSADEPWSANSTMQLVITTNMQGTDWKTLPSEASLGTGNPYDAWQSFEPISDRHINVTPCFSAFNLARKSAQSMFKEPEADWNLASILYNTSEVQKFMGVDAPGRTLGEREIPSMDIIGEPDDGPPDGPAHETITFMSMEGSTITYTMAELTTRVLETLMDYELQLMRNENTTMILCYSCDVFGQPEHPIFGIYCLAALLLKLVEQKTPFRVI